MRMRGAAVAALAALLVAVLASGGHPGAAKGTDARTGAYRIVLESDIERSTLAYTIGSDGSRLTPVLPPNRDFWPMDVSRDGRMIAYGYSGTIYVSRASGTGLRRVVRGEAYEPTFSPDGRRLAYSFGRKSQIGVIGTNGHGRRRLAAQSAGEMDWSPDGKALVYATGPSEASLVVMHPLRGGRRFLARKASGPKWSPDGRWIAYASMTRYGVRTGVWLVQPDGRRRHRVAGAASFSWSPDGRTLAVGAAPRGITLLRADGRVVRRIRLPGLSELGRLAWGPGGRTLIFDRDRIRQVWTVGVDGRGLRQVTRFGNNLVLGWTRLSPTRPPVPPLLPTERVAGPRMVVTRTPIVDLSADGNRVAVALRATAADCSHVAVWTPATGSLARSAPRRTCGEWLTDISLYDVEFAGSRAAWANLGGCGNFCDHTLGSAVLGSKATQQLATVSHDAGEPWDFHVRGDGDLLVFNDSSRLVRIGSGRERCQEGLRLAAVCTTLRRGDHAAPVESVSEGLIAVRENDAVAVLDERGALVRLFPFAASEVTAARLDAGRLVVSRAGVIEVYDVSTGAGLFQQPLPARFRLVDVDGGIAVLLRNNSLLLLRLEDGRSRTLTPGRGPVHADLEQAGLYYSYATTGGGGRVAFMPRSEAEPARSAG